MKKYIRLFTIIFLLKILISCTSSPIATIKPILINRSFKRVLWVVRHSITSKKKIDKLIKFAKENNYFTLLVQVRGRSDAYYSSNIEPTGYDVQPGFDPLAYLVKICSQNNIELHAWVNMMYSANVNVRQLTENHVLYRYPSWATYDKWGKNLLTYKKKQLARNLLEGCNLDPGVPDVVAYTVKVVSDIVRRYNIQGIHFDFIRYPWSGYNGYYKAFLSDFGYNIEARMRFIEKYGVDPANVSYTRASPLRKLWRSFRRERINQVVKQSYKAIKKIKPNVIVSAAVIANAPVVRRVYFQDWKKWAKQGYIDALFPMSYADNMYDFKRYLRVASDLRGIVPLYMGVHIKPNTRVKLSAEQVRLIYRRGFSGFCIFSYDEGQKQIKWLNRVLVEDASLVARQR